MEVEIKMSRKHPSSHNYQDYGKYTLYTTFFSKQNKKNNNNEKKWCQEKQINVQIHKKNPVSSVLHHIFEILGILGMVEIHCGSFESKVVCCETNRPVWQAGSLL